MDYNDLTVLASFAQTDRKKIKRDYPSNNNVNNNHSVFDCVVILPGKLRADMIMSLTNKV